LVRFECSRIEGIEAPRANARHADQEIEPIGEIGVGEASETPFRGPSAASLVQGESAKIRLPL
jgi:hypothetical protein